MTAARRLFAVGTLGLALVLAFAGLAWASSYAISITSPGSGIASDTVQVRLSSTGTDTPTSAAYEVVSGGSWVEASKSTISAYGDGFAGSFDTNSLANDTYTILARAYGADYNPSDANTYAEASAASIQINNAPPVPQGLSASGKDGKITVTWSAISTQDRSDFAGYQVYRGTANSNTCPNLGSFSVIASVSSPTFSQSGVDRTYCYFVIAERTSPTSGKISSDPSNAVLANANGQVASGGDPSGNSNGGNGNGSGSGSGTYVRYGSGGRGAHAPAPPTAPRVREVIPDGPYKANLPYSPMTVDQFNQIVSGGSASGTLETLTSARHRALTLVAAGLLLAIASIQIRRFVAAP